MSEVFCNSPVFQPIIQKSNDLAVRSIVLAVSVSRTTCLTPKLDQEVSSQNRVLTTHLICRDISISRSRLVHQQGSVIVVVENSAICDNVAELESPLHGRKLKLLPFHVHIEHSESQNHWFVSDMFYQREALTFELFSVRRMVKCVW